MYRLIALLIIPLLSGCVTKQKCVDVELQEGGQMMASLEGDVAGFSMPSGTVTITGPGHYRSWLKEGCKPPPTSESIN